MPKINVYLPDELAEAVRDAGLPVSPICQHALEQAVRQVAAVRETAAGDLDPADLDARLPRFTPRTRAVIKLAADGARGDGAPAVGTAHLLRALIAEGDNLGLRVLRAIEIEPSQVVRALERLTAPEPAARSEDAGDGPASGDGPADTASARQRLSRSTAGVVELAVTEAAAFGHNYVGCEHLLLAMVAEPTGHAGQALRSLGAEPRLTRRAVAAALSGYVHLRAQVAGTPAAMAPAPPAGTAAPAQEVTGPGAEALATAIQRELQPLLRRIERLEERTAPPPAP